MLQSIDVPSFNGLNEKSCLFVSEEGSILDKYKDFFSTVFTLLSEYDRLCFLQVNHKIFKFCLEKEQCKTKQLREIVEIALDFFKCKNYLKEIKVTQDLKEKLESGSSFVQIDDQCFKTINELALLISSLTITDRKAFHRQLDIIPENYPKKIFVSCFNLEKLSYIDVKGFFLFAVQFCEAKEFNIAADAIKIIDAKISAPKKNESENDDQYYQAMEDFDLLIKQYPNTWFFKLTLEAFFDTVPMCAPKKLLLDKHLNFQTESLVENGYLGQVIKNLYNDFHDALEPIENFILANPREIRKKEKQNEFKKRLFSLFLSRMNKKFNSLFVEIAMQRHFFLVIKLSEILSNVLKRTSEEFNLIMEAHHLNPLDDDFIKIQHNEFMQDFYATVAVNCKETNHVRHCLKFVVKGEKLEEVIRLLLGKNYIEDAFSILDRLPSTIKAISDNKAKFKIFFRELCETQQLEPAFRIFIKVEEEQKKMLTEELKNKMALTRTMPFNERDNFFERDQHPVILAEDLKNIMALPLAIAFAKKGNFEQAEMVCGFANENIRKLIQARIDNLKNNVRF